MKTTLKNMLVCLLMTAVMGSVCAVAAERVEAPPSCKHCRMDRTMFNYSRMLVTYMDGSGVGTCSLNCVATEMKVVKGKKIKSIQVADYVSRELIDAEKATWVIGGGKRGVMTAVAKWAFGDRKAAEAFVDQYGGKLATFREVLETARTEPQQLD